MIFILAGSLMIPYVAYDFGRWYSLLPIMALLGWLMFDFHSGAVNNRKTFLLINLAAIFLISGISLFIDFGDKGVVIFLSVIVASLMCAINQRYFAKSDET